MKAYPNLPDATLVVGGWSSSCNNCGQQTINWVEHDRVSGYGGGEPGCGIKFTHVSAEYGPLHEEVARSFNPELEYVAINNGLSSTQP